MRRVLLLLLLLLLLLMMSVLQTVEIRLHPDAFRDGSVVGDDRQRLPHFLDVDAGLSGADQTVQAVARRSVSVVMMVVVWLLLLLLLLLVDVGLMH